MGVLEELIDFDENVNPQFLEEDAVDVGSLGAVLGRHA